MKKFQETKIVDGLRAFGGLSDAYMRSANIIAESRILPMGIMLTVTHPKASAGFKSWEVLSWEDIASADDLEKTVIGLFVKHATIVLDNAGLPAPRIRPYRVNVP